MDEDFEFQLTNTDPVELRACAEGDWLRLWGRPDTEYINVYRPGTLTGKGRVASILKADHPKIAYMVAHRIPIWLEVEKIDGRRYVLIAKTKSDATLHAQLRAPEGERRRLLQAHFNGLLVEARVLSVSAELLSGGDRQSTWQERQATVGIQFRPTN